MYGGECSLADQVHELVVEGVIHDVVVPSSGLAWVVVDGFDYCASIA